MVIAQYENFVFLVLCFKWQPFGGYASHLHITALALAAALNDDTCSSAVKQQQQLQQRPSQSSDSLSLQARLYSSSLADKTQTNSRANISSCCICIQMGMQQPKPVKRQRGGK